MAKKTQRPRSYGKGRKYLRGRIWWVTVYDGEGEPIRQSTRSTDELDADELILKLLRERSRGELVAINSSVAYTLGRILDEYLGSCGSLAKGTLDTYMYQAELLRKHFGDLPPAKLTTDMMTDYRHHRSQQFVTNTKRKVGQTSINREIGLLRSALRDVARRRPSLMTFLPYFPMESEVGNARQGFLSEVDFCNKLFPELPRHLQALASCAFYCGGRKSEWLRVDWAGVDFEERLIRFTKSKNKCPREIPIVEGVMLDSLAAALSLQKAAWPDEPAVFVYQGSRMATVGDAWDKACARAGFEGLMFHDLRRSANKLMRDRGIPQGVRMQIMGHRTASMDIRYGIVDRTDLDQAREKLNSKIPKLRRVK